MYQLEFLLLQKMMLLYRNKFYALEQAMARFDEQTYNLWMEQEKKLLETSPELKELDRKIAELEREKKDRQ